MKLNNILRAQEAIDILSDTFGVPPQKIILKLAGLCWTGDDVRQLVLSYYKEQEAPDA